MKRRLVFTKNSWWRKRLWSTCFFFLSLIGIWPKYFLHSVHNYMSFSFYCNSEHSHAFSWDSCLFLFIRLHYLGNPYIIYNQWWLCKHSVCILPCKINLFLPVNFSIASKNEIIIASHSQYIFNDDSREMAES